MARAANGKFMKNVPDSDLTPVQLAIRHKQPHLDLSVPDRFSVLFDDDFMKQFRFVVLIGGAGSGKSVAVGKYLYYVALKENHHRIILAMQQGNRIREASYRTLQDEANRTDSDDNPVNNLSGFIDFTPSRLEADVSIPGRSCSFRSQGFDDPTKIKSTGGGESPSIIWMEEATDFTRKGFDVAVTRLRNAKAGRRQLVMTFNPDAPQSWIEEEFFSTVDFDVLMDKGYWIVTKRVQVPTYGDVGGKRVQTGVTDEEQKTLIIHSTPFDNPWASQDYLAEIESRRYSDPDWYDVYGRGRWMNISGAVLKRLHSVQRESVSMSAEDYDWMGIGLDFGMSETTPSCALLVGARSDKDKGRVTDLYVLKELYSAYGLDTELAEAYKAIMPVATECTADGAQPNLVRLMKSSGINCKGVAKKGVGRRNFRYLGLSWLQGVNIHVSTACPNAMKHFRTYHWHRDASGKLILDANGDPQPAPGQVDHPIDALRYAIDRLVRRWGRGRVAGSSKGPRFW